MLDIQWLQDDDEGGPPEMADDQNLGTVEVEVPEETPEPQQDQRGAEIARLRKELGDARAFARDEAAKRLSNQYGVEITPDALKAVGDIHVLEDILGKVKPKTGPDPEVVEKVTQVQAEHAQFQQNRGVPAETKETYTAHELYEMRQKNEIDDEAMNRLIAEGRMKN